MHASDLKYLTNPYGYRLTYLRFSLTEQCNLSCIYCKPYHAPYWYHQSSKLQINEIKNILCAFKNLGFTKVRFTGGEPSLHPNYLDAIAIANDLGYEKICLTTNAILINNASLLKKQGLTQINVSLNSINPDTFKKITGTNKLKHVLRIIDEALYEGIKVKVNVVPLRTINFCEINAIIDWAITKPIVLRFIEIMPTVLNSDFYLKEQILAKDIIPILTKLGFQKTVSGNCQLTNLNNRGPEEIWEHDAYKAKIGLITPISQSFCKFCNRLRITSDGKLKLCLFDKGFYKLDLSSEQSITQDVLKLIVHKPYEYSPYLNSVEKPIFSVYCFRQIGG